MLFSQHAAENDQFVIERSRNCEEVVTGNNHENIEKHEEWEVFAIDGSNHVLQTEVYASI